MQNESAPPGGPANTAARPSTGPPKTAPQMAPSRAPFRAPKNRGRPRPVSGMCGASPGRGRAKVVHKSRELFRNETVHSPDSPSTAISWAAHFLKSAVVLENSREKFPIEKHPSLRTGDIRIFMILRSEDYYIDADTGKIILTGEYLMKRGYCCNARCRHCPYKKGAVEPEAVPDSSHGISFE